MGSGNQATAKGEFRGGKAKCLASQCQGTTCNLEKDVAGLDHCDPVVDRALALALSRLGRLFGYGFVGEHPNPNFSLPLKVPVDRNAGSLDLVGRHPPARKGLYPKLTKGHGIATRGGTAYSTLVDLTVFRT